MDLACISGRTCDRYRVCTKGSEGVKCNSIVLQARSFLRSIRLLFSWRSVRLRLGVGNRRRRSRCELAFLERRTRSPPFSRHFLFAASCLSPSQKTHSESSPHSHSFRHRRPKLPRFRWMPHISTSRWMSSAGVSSSGYSWNNFPRKRGAKNRTTPAVRNEGSSATKLPFFLWPSM
jgi:hypothetical protein